ncbi:hypothetical protein [Wenyingzhuangia sp. IMCC45467]
MKNFIWILAIMIGGSVSAQKQNDLTGPEAKNYKPWQHNTEATVITKTVAKSNLKSKDVKNQKRWKNNGNTEKTYVIASNYNRNKLQGPAAKNYKPWKN